MSQVKQGTKQFALNRLTTEQDLTSIYNQNLKALSGTINNALYSDDYQAFLNGGTSNSLLFQLITELKNYNYQKFIYKNLPDELNKDILEGMLFLWGRVAIKKISKLGLIAFNIEVKQKDIYGYPKKVDLIGIGNSEYRIKDQVVNKDCVVIYNDTSFFMPNIKLPFGALWRIWALLLGMVKTYDIIIQNLSMSRNILLTETATSKDNIDRMESALRGSKLVIPTNLSQSVKSGNERLNKGFQSINFEDNTSNLWENYFNLWDMIKEKLGIQNNTNAKKKERQINKELEQNNTLAKGTSQLELEMRQLGFNELNSLYKQKISVSLKAVENEESEAETDKEGSNE